MNETTQTDALPADDAAPAPDATVEPDWYCPACGVRYHAPGVCVNQHPPTELRLVADDDEQPAGVEEEPPSREPTEVPAPLDAGTVSTDGAAAVVVDQAPVVAEPVALPAPVAAADPAAPAPAEDTVDTPDDTTVTLQTVHDHLAQVDEHLSTIQQAFADLAEKYGAGTPAEPPAVVNGQPE